LCFDIFFFVIVGVSSKNNVIIMRLDYKKPGQFNKWI